MLQYYFCNSGLILYVCTIYLFYVKKRINDKQNRLFEIMLWIGFSSCFFDILSEEAIRNIDTYPIWLFYLVLYIYFILVNSIPFLSSLYALELIEKRTNLTSNEKLRLYVPVILAMLFICSNYFTNLIFYIDKNGAYSHGIGFIYLVIQAAYYFTLNIVHFFQFKKVIARTIRLMIVSMSAAVLLIILLDIFLFQAFVQSLTVSVCLLLLFIVIQNREEELEDATGLLTNQAFITHVQMDLINQSPFTIILIKLEDKAIINFKWGTNYWFSLIKEVSLYLKSLDGLHDIYSIEDGLFAIRLRGDLPPHKKEQLLRRITSKFALSKWSVLNMDLSISVRMLEISYPTDIEDVYDLFYYAKYFYENVLNARRMLLQTADLSIDVKKMYTEKKKQLMNILESHQYELCFMPIFSVSENKVIGRESLLKLATVPPTYVSPCDLIHETEDYRKLREIHLGIFEDICVYLKNQWSHWQDHELIHINLDVTHLMQENILERYRSILETYHMDYHIFALEISDFMDYNNQPIIYRNLEELIRNGMTLVLEQFGTGHSSFEHFKYIPFKYVKLDKDFIWQSFDNEKGISILKGIIAMMNSLQISIIADGVDTKEINDVLIALGINYLQGAYYL